MRKYTSRGIHGDKYDYSKAVYVNFRTKIVMKYTDNIEEKIKEFLNGNN
jgi:hypothetical protein